MELIVIAHNIRSAHNVGALLRSCDGFGVRRFYATGYTPYPTLTDDTRLPHLRDKLHRQIAKTALGAERTVDVRYCDDIIALLQNYHQQGFTIAALEQTAHSVMLPDYQPPRRLVLLLGEELHGITKKLLDLCDIALEIPMNGYKESFNVSVAAGIALYALCHIKV